MPFSLYFLHFYCELTLGKVRFRFRNMFFRISPKEIDLKCIENHDFIKKRKIRPNLTAKRRAPLRLGACPSKRRVPLREEAGASSLLCGPRGAGLAYEGAHGPLKRRAPLHFGGVRLFTLCQA